MFTEKLTGHLHRVENMFIACMSLHCGAVRLSNFHLNFVYEKCCFMKSLLQVRFKKTLFSLTSPPDDPLGVRLRSYGLFVVPIILLYVSIIIQSSGVFVPTSGMAPESLINFTVSASSCARRPSNRSCPALCFKPTKLATFHPDLKYG